MRSTSLQMRFFESHDPELMKKQRIFLNGVEDPKDRRMNELVFSVGNASHIYYTQSPNLITEESFKEFIQSLRLFGSIAMADDFEKEGFEKMRGSVPYLRYVNEQADIGYEEFMEQTLGKDLYDEYKSIL